MKWVRYVLKFFGITFLLITPYMQARLLLTKIGLLGGNIDHLKDLNALIIIIVALCFSALELLMKKRRNRDENKGCS